MSAVQLRISECQADHERIIQSFECGNDVDHLNIKRETARSIIRVWVADFIKWRNQWRLHWEFFFSETALLDASSAPWKIGRRVSNDSIHCLSTLTTADHNLENPDERTRPQTSQSDGNIRKFYRPQHLVYLDESGLTLLGERKGTRRRTGPTTGQRMMRMEYGIDSSYLSRSRVAASLTPARC